jgi:hypothetical protein
MPKTKCKKTQIGCSTKRKKHQKTQRIRGGLIRGGLIRGGDAYNEIPARYIYPLNDNVMANPVDSRMTGGKRSRKYLKNLKGVNMKGGNLSNIMNPFNLNDTPIISKFTEINNYRV